MLGLAFRHGSLHRLYALCVTLVLASICWCCWRKSKLYRRHSHPSPPRGLLPIRNPNITSIPPHHLHLHHQQSPGSLPLPLPLPPPPPPPLFGRLLESAVLYRTLDEAPSLVKNTDCPVCLSTFEGDTLLTVLPSCNHAYHPLCIDQWLESHKECPICRTEIMPLSPPVA